MYSSLQTICSSCNILYASFTPLWEASCCISYGSRGNQERICLFWKGHKGRSRCRSKVEKHVKEMNGELSKDLTNNLKSEQRRQTGMRNQRTTQKIVVLLLSICEAWRNTAQPSREGRDIEDSSPSSV